MEHVVERARETPVIRNVDVVVAGAGPAGLGAAVGAARAGARTVLVEKHGCVGGMLTAGSVLNIRQYTDDERQIVGGVASELADRIRAAGGTNDTPTKGRHVRHDPEITKYVAQEMLLEAGVDVLLHTMLVDAVVDENTLGGILVENKSGRGAILGRVVVDCTGDGDVIRYSGAAFEKSDGELQPMTLAFIMGGVDAWPDRLPKDYPDKVKEAIEEGSFPTTRRPAIFPLLREGFMYANATRIPGDCTSAEDLTRGEIEGRRQAFALVEWLRSNVDGFQNAYIVTTAPQVGLRESRRLKGLYTLTRDDILSYRQFDDTIALAAYGIDIHYPGKGGEMLWLDPGKSYGIPYRCLVPETMDGLLVAGRCISASHEAIGSARVMAICAATGQGAGVAAALAAADCIRPRHVKSDVLRDRLRKQKAIL